MLSSRRAGGHLTAKSAGRPHPRGARVAEPRSDSSLKCTRTSILRGPAFAGHLRDEVGSTGHRERIEKAHKVKVVFPHNATDRMLPLFWAQSVVWGTGMASKTNRAAALNPRKRLILCLDGIVEPAEWRRDHQHRPAARRCPSRGSPRRHRAAHLLRRGRRHAGLVRSVLSPVSAGRGPRRQCASGLPLPQPVLRARRGRDLGLRLLPRGAFTARKASPAISAPAGC